MASAKVPPIKPTSTFPAVPLAAAVLEPEPVVVAVPAPLEPVGVTRDVVVNVPVFVQEQLGSKKAEV